MKTSTALAPTAFFAILALAPVIGSFAIGQPARIRIPVDVHDSGNGKATLWFGVHPDASRCLDDTLRDFCDGGIIVEQQLGLNPCAFGVFDARFLDPRGPSSGCFDLGMRFDIRSL